MYNRQNKNNQSMNKTIKFSSILVCLSLMMLFSSCKKLKILHKRGFKKRSLSRLCNKRFILLTCNFNKKINLNSEAFGETFGKESKSFSQTAEPLLSQMLWGSQRILLYLFQLIQIGTYSFWDLKCREGCCSIYYNS